MLVGVTGQIGAGKSAVCEQFERLGGELIDADIVGKQVTGSPAVLKRLVKEFGPKIQTSSQKLKPKALGEVVFNDNSGEALEILNSIVQPKLTAELRRKIKGLLRQSPDTPIILDAAILPQWDMIDDCDLVITVIATKDVRLGRLQKRGMSRATAKSRMSKQLTQLQYMESADLVIHNNSSERELIGRAQRIWRKNILQLSGF